MATEIESPNTLNVTLADQHVVRRAMVVVGLASIALVHVLDLQGKLDELPYVGAMFGWNLNFQMSVPPLDEKWGFGIVRADYSGRPAYGRLLGMPKP